MVTGAEHAKELLDAEKGKSNEPEAVPERMYG